MLAGGRAYPDALAERGARVIAVDTTELPDA
jgi:hypothetical protein